MWGGVDDEAVLRVPVSACIPCGLSDYAGERPSFVLLPLGYRTSDIAYKLTTCLTTPQAKEYLPPPTLRRIIHLQSSLLQSSGLPTPASSRALLSSQLPPAPETDSNSATALLLGITGRTKLKEAGDRLRELIVPDVLASAVSVVGAGVGMGGEELEGQEEGGGGGGGGEEGGAKEGVGGVVVFWLCDL